MFDIVPCFFTKEDDYNRTYYIIPDGSGNWKKTDPRIDSERITKINQAHEGNILNVIRAIKYWNSRATMPSMGSYLLEKIILDYYAKQTTVASQYVDLEIEKVLLAVHRRVSNPVYDPKGIQGDINHLSLEDRIKIKDRAYQDYSNAYYARQSENAKNDKDAINNWIEIFGDKFPKYE